MKTKSVRNSIVAGLLTVASVGYSTQVIAGVLALESYSFHQHSGFVVDDSPLLASTGGVGAASKIRWFEHGTGETTPCSPLSGCPVDGGMKTFDTIAWGYQSGAPVTGEIATDPFTTGTNSNTRYSGLRVTGLKSDTALKTGIDLGDGNTDWGDYVPITTIFHRNQPINALAKTLTDALIYSELTFDHGGADLSTSPSFIAVKFKETSNVQAVCADGNPAGDLIAGKPKCDDLFGFSNVGFDPVTFKFGKHLLQVEFALGNFSTSVTDFPVCSGDNPFGPGYECTVWTAEGRTSSLDVLARIREIPEPTTLALFGLSLLGVAGLRRRRTEVAEV